MRLVNAEEFQTIINRVFPCNNCEDVNIRRAMELGLKECHTVDAIIIPKNATNGDVFNSIIDVDNDCVEVEGKDGKMTFTVTQNWWNAPYNLLKQNLAPTDKSGLEYADQPTLQSAT